MGFRTFLKNLPRLMKQESWRQSIVRGILGQPAHSKNEAVLHDAIDLVPILGDFPSLNRIFSNKGNRMNQARDFFIGAIPIAGDIADLFLAGDTNIQQFEQRQQKKGKVETVVTLSFISNTLEKYVGGADRSVWED